jgi:hypothetical protein
MPGDEHASWCLYEEADEDDGEGEGDEDDGALPS